MDLINKSTPICLVTFSDNSDHQEVIYSMFHALYPTYNVYTVGIVNPKTPCAPHTDHNFYFDCPQRPGITEGSFDWKIINQIVDVIRTHKIQYIYYESLHLWNAFVMWKTRKIATNVEAIHDVVPHDNSKSMWLCNFVTAHLAKQVVLRNHMYKEKMASMYHISPQRIVSLDSWRSYPEEQKMTHSGRFLFFGRIRKYKGLDKLKKIIELCPQAHFNVVGSSDEASHDIVQQIKLLPNVQVEDREVSDAEMQTYFTEADWVVLPYGSATQSGVIMDACKFSRPSIAFNVGAISEQIIDGKSGFLIPEGDEEAFAAKIRDICRMSTVKQDKFAHEAYVFGLNKYSAVGAANSFLKILQKNSI